MSKHLHTLSKAALLAALAAFCGAPAAADQMQALIKRYGFEQRNGEIPWGVPVKAKLSDVKVGERTYQIDRATPLTEPGMDEVIKTYLQTHASNEIALIGHLFGGPAGKVTVNVRKASTMEFPAPERQPELKHFRVHLAPIVEKKATFSVHCDFKFIQVGKQFYALYSSGESGRMTSEQPHCDMSSDNTRLPM